MKQHPIHPRVASCLDELQRVAAECVRDLDSSAAEVHKNDANQILIGVCKLALRIEGTQ